MSEGFPSVYSTKRHGATLQNCDMEPVQTPGCVQPHGALLALRVADLVVLQASENSEAILGIPPEAILGKNVALTLGEGCADSIRHSLKNEALERNPLHVARLDLAGAPGPLDMLVHTQGGVALVEFEPAAKDGSEGSLDYYTMLKSTTARLGQSSTLRDFCQTVAEEIRRITGLDRVMVYRFHPDETGEVFAEDKRDDLPDWLGLRYPPHDIPKPAREIFKKIWIRPLPDASAGLAELVPLANPDTGQSLDMTYCVLRGASVMYTEYLANMGVAASLTLSIRRDGELWGLVACHHYTPTRFSYPVRAAAEFLAQFMSLQLKQAEEREHMSYRIRLDTVNHTLLARAAAKGQLSSMLEETPSLLDGIQAGGVAMFHRGAWFCGGATPTESQLGDLAVWLREKSPLNADMRQIYATDRLAVDFPRAAAYTRVGAGLLAVSVSRRQQSHILWFRPEIEQTVHWAGSPHDLPVKVGPHGPRLSPRKSFELWKEEVRGRAEPWNAVEIEAAAKLRLLVMDLVITRAEELSEINAALSRSNEALDSFVHIASHDLKEPLRGINKYAHILLEDARAGRAFDKQAEERMEALLRLTVRMDGLLDALLHFSRVGGGKPEFEDVDLGAMLTEALEMLGARVMESRLEIRIPRPLPTAFCPRMSVREIFANLISNAIKYNERPDPWVEVGFIDPEESPPLYRAELCPPSAVGERVLYVRDNGIGIDPQHFQQIFKIFKRLHRREAYGGGSGAGLAIVKTLVDQQGGAVWLQSTPGEGTTFFFTLGPREGGDL